VPVDAAPTTALDASAFDPFDLPAPAVILQHAVSGEELRLGWPDNSVRLSVRSGTLLKGPVRLSFMLSAGFQLDRHLQSLARLSEIHRGIRKPQDRGRTVRADRRMTLLRTLNVLAVEPNYRAVAVALFGPERVAQDWNSSSDFLKSRVRRLVAQADCLTRGDFRRILADR
jgi:hypothetical protein